MCKHTHIFAPPQSLILKFALMLLDERKWPFLIATHPILHTWKCVSFFGNLFYNLHVKVPLSILIIVNTVTVFLGTVFENRRTWSKLASFWKLEACSQTALPDRSILKRTKVGGKWDILGNFQTQWLRWYCNVIKTKKDL